MKTVSRRAGVTLLETLIAGTVILLVLLSLLGTVSFALEGSRHAEGVQDGSWYAQSLVEVIRDRGLAQNPGFNDAPGARIPIETAPFNLDFPADTGYTRRIVTRRLSTDTTNYQYKLFEIVVTVYWQSKRSENSFEVRAVSREN